MRTFRCACGSRLFFDNTLCNICGRRTAFVPDAGIVSPLEPAGDGAWSALTAGEHTRYRLCENDTRFQVCNWVYPASAAGPRCQACELNQMIPDLSVPEHQRLWREVEKAKRRLVYTLNALSLPVQSRSRDPQHGLGFAFLADAEPGLEFSDQVAGSARVLTGHDRGLITINIAEADDVQRERMRRKMRERYRTLLGHFRHEVGHYYWLLLVGDTALAEPFRALFGDERDDYASALARYYAEGPDAQWPDHFVSPYASAHPWEDWAESFAHYLHMVDTIEAAEDMGFMSLPPGEDIEVLLASWAELTIGLNELNRCMGLRDAYPFVLSEGACDKLRFVHHVILSARVRPSVADARP